MVKIVILLLFIFNSYSIYSEVDNKYSVTAKTIYHSDTKTYQTLGEINLNVTATIASKIASDLKNYKKWALNGINGDKDKGFISVLKDMKYLKQPEYPHGIFRLIYDIDLIWPFGTHGNELDFVISDLTYENDIIKHLRVVLPQEILTMNSFFLDMEMISIDEKNVKIKYNSETVFKAWINVFISRETYKKNVEWRIDKAIRNLTENVLKANDI